MHLSEDILHVCALAHACIMHYRARVCFCTFAVKRSWLGISQPELLCSSSCVSCVPKAVSLHNVCVFDISEHCCLLPQEVSSLWCLTQWPWGQTVGGRPVRLRFTCAPSLVASSSLFMHALQPGERGCMSAVGSHRSLRAMYTACNASECVHRP